MASGKALIGLSAGVIGLSLLAGGPAGAPLAATLLAGLVLAAVVASLVHFSPRMHFGIFPSVGFFHRPWFGGWHSRSFAPAPRMGTTVHSSTFVPAATTSYTPGWGASMRSGLGSFASGIGGHTVHTGHFFRPR
jgi:hypothetical protein